MKSESSNTGASTLSSRPARALWIEIHAAKKAATTAVVEAREGLVD